MGIKTQSQAQTFAPETGSSVVGSTGPGANTGQTDSMVQSGASAAGAIAQVLPHLESGPIGRFAADIALTVQRLGGDSVRSVPAGVLRKRFSAPTFCMKTLILKPKDRSVLVARVPG